MNYSIETIKKRRNYSRRTFTIDEDKKLLELVTKYKENWKEISREMKSRNIRQCKERYFHYLSPNINHEKWKEDEDSLLLKYVEMYGKKWKNFENYFNGRTEIDIRNRFYVLSRLMKKKVKKLGNSLQKNDKNNNDINNTNQKENDIYKGFNNNYFDDSEDFQFNIPDYFVDDPMNDSFINFIC